MNYYRDGNDKIGFHRDDEAEVEGKNIIASLSFGATRNFIIKHAKRRELEHEFSLNSGALIVMRGKTQTNWLHSIPAEPKIREPRVNLTFRKS